VEKQEEGHKGQKEPFLENWVDPTPLVGNYVLDRRDLIQIYVFIFRKFLLKVEPDLRLEAPAGIKGDDLDRAFSFRGV
jgi:hypothetical protein